METDNGLMNRWILPKPINEAEITNINLNHTLQAVLIRRGIDLNNEFDEYITPSDLPNPEEHFDELSKATQRIIKACVEKEKIAICGDYDADGITSTVLLVELLTILGAIVKPFIPSRQDEGYGLNENMINNIYNQGIKLVITVDNGISAFDAIKKSVDLGIDLIITDHHKIPDKKLNVFSLIHPEKTPINSPYKYLAGVGIAYLLAKNICEKLDYDMYKTTTSIMTSSGYKQYEASNYAKDSKECRHNLHYWNLDPYLAFGPSAHGYDGSKRWWNHRSLDKYISDVQSGKLPINNSESLSAKDHYNEMIMNGLRTSTGINTQKLISLNDKALQL